MKHEKLKPISDKQFRRVTGVKRGTFAKIIELLKVAQKKKMAKGGRPNNHSLEDRLLMTL